MILGQHYTQNEYDGRYAGSYCDEKDLKQYVNQVIDGMKTGLFSCVAHPDLINYRENVDVYKREMTRLCEAAVNCKIPLEFNLLGLEEKRHYPYMPFWKEIVSKVGNEVIIGCDAHNVVAVGNPQIYNTALKLLDECRIKPLKQLTLKSV